MTKLAGARENDHEARPFPRGTFHANRPVMQIDDALAKRQAKAVPLLGVRGVALIEAIEEMRTGPLVHAATVVDYGTNDFAVGGVADHVPFGEGRTHLPAIG